MVIILGFLAVSKKAPAKVNGAAFVSFEDDAEYVFFVEKKLQGECLVVDLIGFFVWKLFYFHVIGNDNSGIGMSFKGNPFHGPLAGWG